MDIARLCETPGVLRVFMILGVVIDIVKIVVPIIITIMIMIDLFKIVTGSKDSSFQKFLPTAAKRLIAGLVIFFLPSLIAYALSFAGESLDGVNACVVNATKEKIEYYDKLEPVELKIQTLEASPNERNLEAARKAVQTVTTIASEDKMMDYMQRISAAEREAEKYKKMEECRAQAGTYKDGYCTLPVKHRVPEESENNSSTGNNGGSYGNNTNYNGGGSGGGTIDKNGYHIVNTKVSVDEYLKIVSANRIAQNNDSSIYGGYCLAFAYIHAYSLWSGDTSKRAHDAPDYVFASKFDGYENDDINQVLANVYNEIMNGRPCLIQVNGNKAGTSRHYVTVVGVSKNATANNISQDDLLIIDSWDGKLEGVGNNGARFMVTGAACKKKYSGYQMYYLE